MLGTVEMGRRREERARNGTEKGNGDEARDGRGETSTKQGTGYQLQI